MHRPFFRITLISFFILFIGNSTAHAQFPPGGIGDIENNLEQMVCALNYCSYMIAHPRIRSTISLEVDLLDGKNGSTLNDGIYLKYEFWPESWQQRVGHHFIQYCMDQPLDIDFEPPLSQPAGGHQSHNAYHSLDQGRDIYFANIAWSIYVDAYDIVPWDLEDNSGEELSYIFNGTNYFLLYRHGTTDGNPMYYAVPKGSSIATTENILGDPRDVYDFLSSEPELGKNLIGETPWETAANLTEWLHDYWWHVPAPPFDATDFFHNHPMLTDRLEHQHVAVYGWVYMPSAGCWSTSAFFADLMRVVNIPIKKIKNQVENFDGSFGTHSGMEFDWHGTSGQARYMLHSDDIYTSSFIKDPIPPVGISRSQTLWDDAWLSATRFVDTYGYDHPAPAIFTSASIEEHERGWHRAECMLPSASAISNSRNADYDHFVDVHMDNGLTAEEADDCWNVLQDTVLSWGDGDWEEGYDVILDNPDSIHNKWCDRTDKC